MEQTPQTKGSKKSTGAIIIAVLIIVIVVVLWAVNSSTNTTRNNVQTTSQNPVQPTFNRQLSKADQEKEPTKAMEVAGGPFGKGKNSVKTYEVRIENGIYNPSELVVQKGGRVQISMIAADANYDVVFAAPLGVYLNIQKGQAAVFGFDASDDKVGEYIFTCKDVCPASGAMQGRLIIK